MTDGGVDDVALRIYHDELARALNFTASDLQDNRAGRLSVSQRSTLLRAFANSMAKTSVPLLLAFGCVVGAFAIGVTTGLGPLLLVLAAALLVLVGMGAWSMLRLWRDVEAGTVSSAEGLVRPGEKEIPVQVGAWPSGSMWAYYWTVDGGRRFWVPGKIYPILMPARHGLLSAVVPAASSRRSRSASGRIN